MAPGGVDMRTGRYAYSETDLAIGGDSGALALTRSLTADVPGHGNPFGNFSHNWDIMVSEMRVNFDDPQQSGADFRIFVHFGGRSQTFKSRADSGIDHWRFQQESRGGFAPLTVTGDKATAAVVYTYRAADGTVAEFRPLGALGSGDCSHVRRCAYVVADHRAGRHDPHLRLCGDAGARAAAAERLRSVTSSRGYALLFEGTHNRVTKACVINLALGALPATLPVQRAGERDLRLCERDLQTRCRRPVIRLTGSPASPARTTRHRASLRAATMSFIRPGESAPVADQHDRRRHRTSRAWCSRSSTHRASPTAATTYATATARRRSPAPTPNPPVARRQL